MRSLLRHCRATTSRETTRRRLILSEAACKIDATGCAMAWMIGVDVGGTFTDFFAFDDTDDRIVLHKVPSTPANPAQAVIAGLRELTQNGVDLAAITRLSHGTTVATNALIQRRGGKVALVVTA